MSEHSSLYFLWFFRLVQLISEIPHIACLRIASFVFRLRQSWINADGRRLCTSCVNRSARAIPPLILFMSHLSFRICRGSDCSDFHADTHPQSPIGSCIASDELNRVSVVSHQKDLIRRCKAIIWPFVYFYEAHWTNWLSKAGPRSSYMLPYVSRPAMSITTIPISVNQC